MASTAMAVLRVHFHVEYPSKHTTEPDQNALNKKPTHRILHNRQSMWRDIQQDALEVLQQPSTSRPSIELSQDNSDHYRQR